MKVKTLQSLVRFLILALVLIIPFGCRSSKVIGSNLASTAWHLTEWSVSSLTPTDFTITAKFDTTKISGNSVVNQYSGTYSTNNEGGFFVSDLTMTEIGGSEEDMRAELTYYDLLKQAIKYTVNESKLTLLDEKYVDLDKVLIRSIILPATIKSAIESKLKQEQESLEYEFKIEKPYKKNLYGF